MRLALLFGSSLFAVPALAQDGGVVISSGESSATEVYSIQRGDTLWDISYKFLGNPYYWPRLWSINDYVTNPHWIYPGNEIHFIPGTLVEPISVELGDPLEPYDPPPPNYELADLECGPDIVFTDTYGPAVYTSPGFIADRNDIEVFGEIKGSKRGMRNLGEGDLVYLSMDNINEVRCGDVFSIYRQGEDRIRHPENRRRKYGHLFRVLAEARIVHIEGDVATAVLRQSYGDAERGDLVGPLVPVATQGSVRNPRGDLEGVIIARLQDGLLLAAEGETVFLDVGSDDGVQEGNTFHIIHRRDEYVDLNQYDEELPAQAVGRILIVRVDETTSSGVIVDSARRIKVGDKVAMKID